MKRKTIENDRNGLGCWTCSYGDGNRPGRDPSLGELLIVARPIAVCLIAGQGPTACGTRETKWLVLVHDIPKCTTGKFVICVDYM